MTGAGWQGSDRGGRKIWGMSFMKKKIWLCTIAVSFLIGGIGSQPAHSAELGKAARELSNAMFVDNLATPASRAMLVNSVKNYCLEIERRYPRNSPNEDIWLDTEIDASGDRMIRVMNSPEFGRRMAANFIIDCKGYASEYSENGKKVYGLIGLARNFVKFYPDAELYAKKNNMNVEDLGFGGLRLVTQFILMAALNESM
jgi:hypothetical protein